MAASQAASRGIQIKVGSRTIFVKAVPTPITFAERRGVLQALQQHGRIEVFKKLPKSPSSFISVAAMDDTATKLIVKSPLTYQLLEPKPDSPLRSVLPNTTAGPVVTQITTPLPPNNEQAAAPDPTTHTSSDARKEFTLHIFPSRDYSHWETIKKSPLYGPWPKQLPNTVMKETLRASVPNGVAKEGLIDWSIDLDETRAPRLGAASYAWRTQRRDRKNSLPAATKGLVHLRQQEDAQIYAEMEENPPS